MNRKHEKTHLDAPVDITAGVRPRRKLKKAQLDKLIGHNIATTRMALEFARDELAEMLDLTTNHLGLIERGERGATATTLASLSEVLNIPVDQLFTDNQNKESEDLEEQVALKKSRKIMSLLTRLNVSEINLVIRIINAVKNMRPDS